MDFCDRGTRPSRGRWDQTLRYVFVSSALIATATFGWLRYDDYTSGSRVPRSLVREIMSGGHPLRDDAFRVSEPIIVYSNYRCRFCRTWADSLEALLSIKVHADVRVKHLAPPAVEPGPFEAAMAAECAAEQGRFPEYHRGLFNLQSISHDALVSLATEVGIADSGSFTQCVDDERYRDVVMKQTKEAALAGIRGIPATIVGRTIFTGVRPIADIRAEAER